MTPSDRARLVELCERATPGPWSVPDGNRLLGAVSATISGMARQVASACGQAPQFEDVADCGARMAANAAFIAAARSALPELLAENERLRGLAIEAVKIGEGMIDLIAPGLDTFRDLAITDLDAISKELSNV